MSRGDVIKALGRMAQGAEERGYYSFSRLDAAWTREAINILCSDYDAAQLKPVDAEELSSRIIGAFYARHPEVLKAINRDAGGFGCLTEKTKKMVRMALDRDAGMKGALEGIKLELSCDPSKEPTLRMDKAYRIAASSLTLSSHQQGTEK